jgi:hypothetical protein
MTRIAELAAILGTVFALLSLIVSIFAYMRVNPESPWLRRTALGTAIVGFFAMSFLGGWASANHFRSSGTSNIVAPSWVKPIYHDNSVRVAQKSLYHVGHPGEELSSKYLVLSSIRIDWNGQGEIVLSGDNNGPARIWVDDILDVSIINPDGQERTYYQDFSNNCTKGTNSGGGLDLTKYFEPGKNTIQITITDNANCSGKNATVGSSDIFLQGVFRKLP